MPLEQPFSAAEIAANQAAMQAAILQEAQIGAVGGATWTIERSEDDEDGSAAAAIGTLQASIYRVRLSAEARALAGADAPDAIWRLVAQDGQMTINTSATDPATRKLWIGDVLTSQVDSRLRFQVTTLDLEYGVLVGELEAIR